MKSCRLFSLSLSLFYKTYSISISPNFVHKHTLWTSYLSPHAYKILKDLSKCTMQIENTAVSIESHSFFCSP